MVNGSRLRQIFRLAALAVWPGPPQQLNTLGKFGRIALFLPIAFSTLKVSTAAFAADKSRQTSTDPSIFSWAGFYFGANTGAGMPLHVGERLQAAGGFGSSAFDLYPQSRERAGATFGAQAGYNWQFGHFVAGLETDFNFLDGRRGPIGTFAAPFTYWPIGVDSYTLNAETSGTYFSTFRGRLGVAFDRVLVYGTGGVANGGWRGPSTLMLNGGGPGNPFTSDTSQSSRMKYAVGGGVEGAIGGDWSARFEYLFLDQSLNTMFFDNGNGFNYLLRTRNQSHVLRFGLNYHFWEPGEAAKQSAAADKSDENRESRQKDKDEAPERYSAHGQVTFLPQGYLKFPAAYSGQNSLLPQAPRANATVSATGFFGLRLWEGGAGYVNPEMDQGFGIGNAHGVAAFPSTEAFKAGRAAPYLRFQRYFLRQTIGLGGEKEKIEGGQNQLAETLDANRLILTVGKFAVVDIFDDNKYAHDGRNGFINWMIADMGAFDYAADAWAFTYGAAAEWKQNWWTARAGIFQLPLIPGGAVLDPVLGRQFSPIVEFEARHSLLFNQPAKIKFLGFANIGYMGKYGDAVTEGLITGATPDITLDRRRRAKIGGGINVEQPLTDDLGFFLRASINNGRYASYYTDGQRSLTAGFVLTGAKWDRPLDAIGVAGVVSGLSGSQIKYFENGGLGVLIGDGALSYGGERILETYYKLNVAEGVHLTADWQYVGNPAYNHDRGPVSIFALRLHGEF